MGFDSTYSRFLSVCYLPEKHQGHAFGGQFVAPAEVRRGRVDEVELVGNNRLKT